MNQKVKSNLEKFLKDFAYKPVYTGLGVMLWLFWVGMNTVRGGKGKAYCFSLFLILFFIRVFTWFKGDEPKEENEKR